MFHRFGKKATSTDFDELKLEVKLKIFTNHKKFVFKEGVEVSESELKEANNLISKATDEVQNMETYINRIDSFI